MPRSKVVVLPLYYLFRYQHWKETNWRSHGYLSNLGFTHSAMLLIFWSRLWCIYQQAVNLAIKDKRVQHHVHCTLLWHMGGERLDWFRDEVNLLFSTCFLSARSSLSLKASCLSSTVCLEGLTTSTKKCFCRGQALPLSSSPLLWWNLIACPGLNLMIVAPRRWLDLFPTLWPRTFSTESFPTTALQAIINYILSKWWPSTIYWYSHVVISILITNFPDTETWRPLRLMYKGIDASQTIPLGLAQFN